MTYIIDTDWMIDHLAGKRSAADFLPSILAFGAAISLMTYGEVYEGIYKSTDPERSEAAFLDALQLVDLLPIDQRTMRRFARMRGTLRKLGQRIEDTDLLIAATALEHDLVLITRNFRHFRRVPGLKLYESG